MNVQSVQQPVARQSETPRGAAPGNRESNCPLARAKQFIDDHFRDPINLERITTYAGLSRFTLAKQFGQRLGVSPHRCLCAVRVQYAQSLMEKGHRPSDIANKRPLRAEPSDPAFQTRLRHDST